MKYLKRLAGGGERGRLAWRTEIRVAPTSIDLCFDVVGLSDDQFAALTCALAGWIKTIRETKP